MRNRSLHRRSKHSMYLILILFVCVIIAMITRSFALKQDRTYMDAAYWPYIIKVLEKVVPESLYFSYGNGRIEDRQVDVYKPYYTGGSVSYTLSPNSIIDVSFQGHYMEWIGFQSPDSGIVAIYLDGRFIKEIDLYSKKFAVQSKLYSSEIEQSGVHTFRIVATGRNNTDSTGYRIGFDSLIVINDDQKFVIENEEPSIRYIHGNHYEFSALLIRKLGHFSFYFLITMSLLIYGLYSRFRVRHYLAVLISVLIIAILDESIQFFQPGRHPSYIDVLIDVSGILLAFFILVIKVRIGKLIKL